MIFCCLYLTSTSSFPFYFLSVTHSVVSPSPSSFSTWCVSLFLQLFCFIFFCYVFLHVLFQLHVCFITFLVDLFSFSYFCSANPTPNFLLCPYITLTHSCFSSLLSDVFTMLSLPEWSLFLFLMSHTYAHWFALCWALFSLSDTHSCYCGKTASADASLSLSVWSPYFSHCLMYNHLKHNKNCFFFPSLLSFQTFPLCRYFPVPRTILLLNNTQPQLVSGKYSHLLHH